jgi:hypothetical protein
MLFILYKKNDGIHLAFSIMPYVDIDQEEMHIIDFVPFSSPPINIAP